MEDRGILKHGNRWSQGTIIWAIHLYVQQFGYLPTSEAWKHGGWPSYNAVCRHFGSWANAIEAAGYERPKRGIYTRTSRNQRRGPYKRKAPKLGD
jgi:hypothetical protein